MCKQKPPYLKIGFSLLILFLIAGCSADIEIKDQDRAPAKKIDVSKVKDAVPRVEPKSKYGNPESYVVFGKRYYVKQTSKGYKEQGIASWYGTKFHGRRTSSGETYDMYAMTAAHKTLPLPAYVSVRNMENGRSIIVRVNDRGPFHEGRIIDLSYTAALKLDVVKTGTARVEVRAIAPGDRRTTSKQKQEASPVKITYGQSGFYIQAATFSVLENARKLQEKLSSTSAHLVAIKQFVLNNQTLYRVLIGPVNNIDVADKIVLKLEEYGIHNPKFITEQ